MISKTILDRINKTIKVKTKSNHWQNTHEVLDWFKKMKIEKNSTFFQFDIESFYPSITEELLGKSLDFAAEMVKITSEEKSIILHSRKNFLFWQNKPWVKKNNENFDVPMGGYDSAEVSDLVGQYLLNQIENIIPQSQIGLYRDDALGVLNLPGPQVDRTRKQIIKMLKDNGLKITVQCNVKHVNFLDVTLNLEDHTYKPYKKDIQKTMYINIGSNHPPNIKRDLPQMVERSVHLQIEKNC